MKYFLTFIISLLIYYNSRAQIVLPDSTLKYHSKKNALFIKLCNSNDKQIINEIESLFKSKLPQPYDIKTYIQLLENINNSDSLIIKWAKIGISKYGMRTVDLFNEDKTDYYDSILNYKDLSNVFYNSKFENKRDLFNVEHYFFNDTYFRTKLTKYQISEDTLVKFNTLLFAVQYDSLEIKPFIMYMIKKYNFPSPEQIGYYYTELFNFILRHHDISDSIYTKALKEEKIHPIDFASLISYSYFKRKILNSDYSPQIKYEKGKSYLKKMDNYLAIDKRRMQIGLPAIYYYSKLAKSQFQLNNEYLQYWIKHKKEPISFY